MRAICGSPSPGSHPDQGQQAGADRADGFAVDDDAGLGDALDQGEHGNGRNGNWKERRAATHARCMSQRRRQRTVLTGSGARPPARLPGCPTSSPACSTPSPPRSSRLPWPWLRRLGDGMAALWLRRDVRESRVARRNLELAYPELLPAQRDALHRDILRTTARQTLETLRLWTQPHADNLRLIREHAGRGAVRRRHRRRPRRDRRRAALRQLGTAEPVAGLAHAAGDPVPPAGIGRRRGLPAHGPRRRRRPRDPGARRRPGIRQLFKLLKDGGVVGILPDQQPKAGDGEFAPFFGVAGADDDPARPAGRTHRRDRAVRLLRAQRRRACASRCASKPRPRRSPIPIRASPWRR